ncbi:hypothetical protein GYA27_04480 [candidate division WWE3 bacterium]|uniref:Ferric oxidoreductase domain-containing protein n=1 Tax=candidate division WWE3 bacterium TaxID=2053526 RepID=A0A7X9DL21_UNCKA|nr:hypothetical protein [candidate division WWE3 bacterium]
MYGKSKTITLVLSALVILILGFYGTYSLAQESSGSAAVYEKDTDFDGITDKAELEKYKTDPFNADTDGDSILDYQEVVDGSDPLNPKSNIIAHEEETTKFLPAGGIPTFWYIGRIAGISAFIMFTFVVIFGLLMTSKFLLKYRIISAPDALETHSFNATFIALTLVIIHFSSFLFDDVLHMTLKEALIPFALVRPDLRSAVGLELGMPIALGIFALYVSLILVATSRLKNKLISAKNWRKVHYLSFLFYLLFMVHAILAGTDSTEWWMITIYASSGITVTVLILLRIFGKKYFINSIRATAKPIPTNIPTSAQNQNSEPISQIANS